MFKFLKRLFKGKEGGTLVGNIIGVGAHIATGGLIGRNPVEVIENYIDGTSRVEYPSWLDKNGNGSVWN